MWRYPRDEIRVDVWLVERIIGLGLFCDTSRTLTRRVRGLKKPWNVR